MVRRFHSNIAIDTTLVGGITGTDTALIVADATGWPTYPFVLVIEKDTGNEELIFVGNKSGTNFSALSRGYGGTAAIGHNEGSPIHHVAVAEDFDEVFLHNHEPSDGYTALNHASLTNIGINDHHLEDHTARHSDGSDDALLPDAIATDMIQDAAIITEKIAPLNVVTGHLADLSVTTEKINNLAVTAPKIADLNVTTAKITDLNVTTGKIADGAVTAVKMSPGSFTSFIQMGVAQQLTDGALATSATVELTHVFNRPTTWNTYEILVRCFAFVALGGPATTDVVHLQTRINNYMGDDIAIPDYKYPGTNGNADGPLNPMPMYAAQRESGISIDATIQIRLWCTGGNSAAAKRSITVDFLAIRAS